MSIAVVIPSRLAGNPLSRAGGGPLYLDRAIASVHSQTRKDLVTQLIICVDPGKMGQVPARIAGTSPDGMVTEVVEGMAASQASVLNAGLRSVKADWVAFLEDDDVWRPTKIAVQWGHMGGYDLVSCSQEEVSEEGKFVRINDYATPSGWLLRAAGRQIPPFDESFRWHIDADMLGRLQRASVRRLHLATDFHAGVWLANVARSSAVVRNAGAPLVIRTVNSRGGMAEIARSARAARQSRLEHEEMGRRYADLFPATGGIPW